MNLLTVTWEDLKPRPPVSFLLATAVAVERDAVLRLMSPLRGRDRLLKVPCEASTYFLGEVGRYPCVLVMGEAGSDTRKGSALEILTGIDRWDPLAVIAVGIAFGRADASGAAAQMPGDVLVSTQLYPYHHAKLSPDAVEERGPRPEASPVLLDRVRNSFWRWHPAGGAPRSPILGPLLSGPYLLNDAWARDNLFRRFPRAIGGEMEATGLYSASSLRGTHWIVIKAVCDWGAEKRDDHQTLAADNAAQLVLALLSEEGLTAAAFARRASGPTAPAVGWHEIDFGDQEDLRAALAGDSLGPRHVLACPPLPEVDDIVRHLEVAGAVAVVGPSGSGKSMAAWHAAHRLHLDGWKVYTGASASAPLPTADPRVLIVVDDAQALSTVPVTSALASPSRRLLVVSTDPVPGYRRTVRIIPEAAVADIADRLLERADQLLPILQTLDPQVGDSAGRIGVAGKVAIAKQASKLPWQFMFNLSSGHLRLDASFDVLARVQPRATVLFAIAVRQLATMDGGADRHWLEAVLTRNGIAVSSLSELVGEIGARVPLVQLGERLSTPHPQVAERVINAMWRGEDAQTRHAIYWELFSDSSIQLGGLAWLARTAPIPPSGVPERLLSHLLARCWTAENLGHAGFLLATLLSHWKLDPEHLAPGERAIQGWLAAGVPQHAPGISRLVNEILNADFSRSSRAPLEGRQPKPSSVARELVSNTPAVDIAAWANSIALDEAGSDLAALLERLGTAGSSEWRAEVAALLDRARLETAVRAARPEELETVAALIVATNAFNPGLARTLVREATPAIVAAMRSSLPESYSQISDIFWRVLGFAPAFFGRSEPDDEQRVLAVAILEGVGAESFASQLSQAPRRDWNTWRNFSEVLRHATPHLANAVGRTLDLARLVDTARAELVSICEVDELVVALALTDHLEPGATLVRRVSETQKRMTWRMAYVAPDAASRVIEHGITFELDLGGGLPRWAPAAKILLEIRTLSVANARALLHANLNGLSDGLLYRQADGGEGAIGFLQVALEVAEDVVLEAFRRVDVENARATWPLRINGSDEQRATMREITRIAKQAGGPIAALAAEQDMGAIPD